MPTPTPVSMTSFAGNVKDTSLFVFGQFGTLLNLCAEHPVMVAMFALLLASCIVGFIIKVRHA